MPGLCYVGRIERIDQPNEDGMSRATAWCGWSIGLVNVAFPGGHFLAGDLCEVTVSVERHAGTRAGSGIMVREVGDELVR
jgi:hypothetical protein